MTHNLELEATKASSQFSITLNCSLLLPFLYIILCINILTLEVTLHGVSDGRWGLPLDRILISCYPQLLYIIHYDVVLSQDIK